MDKQRYLVKIQQLKQNIDEIQRLLPKSELLYLRFNIRRLAIERLFQMAIEIVLDVCAMIIADLHLGPPEDEDHLLDLLKDKLTNIENIKQMKRFRNIIVHKYGEINHKMVYQIASENLGDFQVIIADFLRFLD